LSEPRILLLDIETSPIIIASWSLRSPEASAVYVLRDTYIIAIGYKWLGDPKPAKSKILPDFPRHKKNRHCDKALMGFVWKLLDEADIVVAHNAPFDLKKINSRLWVNGFQSPSSYQIIDTLKWARATFKLDSNKLDNIVRYKSLGRKLANTGAALWHGCCELNDPKSWKTMREYNAHDTELLGPVVLDMRGWVPNHPNINLWTGKGGSACPTCQSTNFKRSGLHYLKTTVRQRFKCYSCGARWCGDIVKGATCDSQSRPARATSRSRAATLRTRTTATNRKTRSTGRVKRRGSERA
jgi:hypothetical protein